MKKLFFILILLFSATFVFANNQKNSITTDFQKNENKNPFVDNYDFIGRCFAEIVVTMTNTETGESHELTYWVDLGYANNEFDCKVKAAIYVAGL